MYTVGLLGWIWHSDFRVSMVLVRGFYRGELRLSGNHTVTEYEMSGEPYSQKSDG